jgi:hypothetical protein
LRQSSIRSLWLLKKVFETMQLGFIVKDRSGNPIGIVTSAELLSK